VEQAALDLCAATLLRFELILPVTVELVSTIRERLRGVPVDALEGRDGEGTARLRAGQTAVQGLA
jgi:hypothetical protein